MSTPSEELDDSSQSGHDVLRPPTPAESPRPDHVSQLDWSTAGDQEDSHLASMRSYFMAACGPARKRLLGELLNVCTSEQLSFVNQFVSPLLKKDPFTSLPDELCLRILSFIDDPRALTNASQVSNRWRDLLSDDMTWKNLCEKHGFGRRLSVVESFHHSEAQMSNYFVRPQPQPINTSPNNPLSRFNHFPHTPSNNIASGSRSFDSATAASIRRPKMRSYKSHFKQRYRVETAWRSGGIPFTKHITPDQGVVTSLHLTPNYIVVALDNAKIHVFDTKGGNQKTLIGHVMGVWAMVPWADTLVSGGCDRDVRVWNLATGDPVFTLRGHTSTVRCLKMADAKTAISGSRDTTLRIWDIEKGVCKNVLVGHNASVRCLEIHGDIVVSGSYDTTARVWSISQGACLRTLQGHFSQIYAIAFDGHRIATGSLDTSVRIWDPKDGVCVAILQGHTSLVGQLQMRGNTLVTGGSDGSVRVWSLEKMAPIHRLAAHDNSVTSLQFDDNRIVSGGSDGRVKVWDLKTGQLVRELSAPADTVWRVAFEDEKCVIMASRQSRTMMEVWSFAPPEDIVFTRSTGCSLDNPSDNSIFNNTPTRPLSAVEYREVRILSDDHSMSGLTGDDDSKGVGFAQDDIEMADAGPSTAPTRTVGAMSFFHDD